MVQIIEVLNKTKLIAKYVILFFKGYIYLLKNDNIF